MRITVIRMRKTEYIDHLNKYLLRRDTKGFLRNLKDYIEKFHSIKYVSKETNFTQANILKYLNSEMAAKTEHINMILDTIRLEMFYAVTQDYEEKE